MELIHGNFRAFECSILDFENIMEIYNSRTHIQGSPRTPQADENFKNHLVETLLGNKKEFVVLAVEEITSKKMISFATYVFPTNSQFGFAKLGGTIPKPFAILNYSNNGAISLLRLGVMIGESKGYYDIFWSVKLSSYLPMCKLFNSFEKNTGEEHRSYWMLHKVVYPDDPLITSIDKFLLETALVKRMYPVAIIHTCLKEKYRIEHYKNSFGVSEETIKRCTVPGYAFSTSTNTSPETNS